jgi:hypothetical protein
MSGASFNSAGKPNLPQAHVCMLDNGHGANVDQSPGFRRKRI